jgi:small subunit ribosomal protein S25e
MGGKKKRSMKKMAKTGKSSKPKKQETKTAPAPAKKSVPGITPPNLKSEKFTADLKKMKVITPYSVASRFNIRMSIARHLLRNLERKGMIKFVSKSQNLRIYRPAD